MAERLDVLKDASIMGMRDASVHGILLDCLEPTNKAEEWVPLDHLLEVVNSHPKAIVSFSSEAELAIFLQHSLVPLVQVAKNACKYKLAPHIKLSKAKAIVKKRINELRCRIVDWQKLLQPEIQSEAEIIASMDSHVKKWHVLNAQLPEDKRLPSPFPALVLID
jgi:hypothetical protein